MDYVIWDFRGQSNGRPTRCSQRESCLVKVFRFQRKTLLFLLGFFFPIIIFFFLPILFRRFLEKHSIDFHEIFTHDTLW